MKASIELRVGRRSSHQPSHKTKLIRGPKLGESVHKSSHGIRISVVSKPSASAMERKLGGGYKIRMPTPGAIESRDSDCGKVQMAILSPTLAAQVFASFDF